MVVEHARAAGIALVVADGHAALEVVDEPAIPRREVGRRLVLPVGREDGNRVDEAIDRAALPAHDVVDRVTVHRRGLGQVRGRRRIRIVIRPAPAGGPVLEGDHRVDGAVRVDRRSELGIRPVTGVGAVEDLLLRAREDGAAHRMVGEHDLLDRKEESVPGRAQLEQVVAHCEIRHDTLEPPRVARGREGVGHVLIVYANLDVVDGDEERNPDRDARIVSTHVLGRAREHLDAGGRCGRSQQQRGDREQRDELPAPVPLCSGVRSPSLRAGRHDIPPLDGRTSGAELP